MPFKKGNKAAKGREMPEGQLAVARLTVVQLRTLILTYMSMSRADIKRIHDDPDTPMVDLYIISILINGAKVGDDRRFDALFNRALGKVADRVEFEDKTDQAEIDRLKEEYKKTMSKP